MTYSKSRTRVGAGGFLALGCVGFIASAPAMAQAAQPEQSRTLGGVTVTDTAIDGPAVKAEEAASPKYTAPLLDTPQTITVITNASIQQQNLLTLRDVLQTVPGITFGAGEGGFGYGDRIILRGQDAKNDVTIDGVRSSAFLNRNETFNIEQVEVTNGANSVYNGGGSVAGTINLVTKKPTAETTGIVSAGIGTDEYYRGTVDANFRLNELVAFRLNGVYHHNDVPGRDVESYERWGVAPAVTIGIDGPTSLTLQYEHLDDKGKPQYGLRYYPHLGGFLPEFDREGYYGFANLDRQNAVTDAFQAIFTHDFSDRVSIRSLSRFEAIEQDTVTSQPNGTFCLANGLQPPTAPTIVGTPIPVGAACTVNIQTAAAPAAASQLTVPAGYYLPTGGRGVRRLIENDTLYTQLDLSAQFDSGPIGHNLVIGASGLWENYEQRQGNINRTAEGFDPYAAPFTGTGAAAVANPLYNAGASLGIYLPLVPIGSPGVAVPGPAAGSGLPRVYGTNNYVGPVNFIQSSLNEGEREAFAVYLFDTMSFGEMFEINGGVRYEHAKGFNVTQAYSVTPGATLGQPTTRTGPFRNSDDLLSYRVGAVFKPVPEVSLYAAYGNSKNPSQASVDGACTALNCNLEPETTKNYEIGAKADLFGGGLLVSAAVFRNDRDSIRIASNDPIFPEQRLDGRQRVDGISLGASGNVTDNWTISANYMYLDATILQSVSDFCLGTPGATGCGNSAAFLDPAAGAELTNTPEHSGSLFTTYRFPFGLELGYGLTYQGSFALNTPTLADRAGGGAIIYRVPDYTIHRFYASYAITDAIKAQVNVQNFTDEDYVTTVRNALGSSWAQPGVGRSAVFSLSLTY